jgi:hypothetical protein
MDHFHDHSLVDFHRKLSDNHYTIDYLHQIIAYQDNECVLSRPLCMYNKLEEKNNIEELHLKSLH